MTSRETSSVVLRLKSERDALEPLNRTVAHRLFAASENDLLAGPKKAQHVRRIPLTKGVRRDAYFWDSWDRKVRGEDDLRRSFEVLQRIGELMEELQGTAAEPLLPGTVDEILGRRTDLFLPDYWLFIVHHLGWSGQLPYECDVQWHQGCMLGDKPFSLTSRLVVNIVQASIDALTVLIDALRPDDGDLPRNQADRPFAVDDDQPVRLDHAHGIALLRPPSKAGRTRKRADRAANIEALVRELSDHLRAARDHAQAAADFGRPPELLPRPSRRDLAKRIGIAASVVSRCFSDPAAKELNLLWEMANDLEAVLRFVRQ